ncbi:hypothetical protein, partial [Flavobacterium sp. HSC-61S13]|uniref:hypothetical protein n=1 Tax=Flavobacterium sp. HSC-61S13 TaxID=2910963 RepID=UPI00209F8DA9
SPLRICNAPGSTFDLTVYDNIVYHGIPGFKVDYYKSNADAMAQIDPIVGAAAYDGKHHEFIFVRVSSLTDPTLYAITSFELLRDVIPVVNKGVTPLISCVDASGPATAVFNLNTKDNEVKLSASGLVVEYYLTQAEANTGDVTKALPKWNYQSGEKTVWVRVYSPSSACYSITSVDLKFNIAPVLVGPNEYIVCDNLGISTFDLTVIASDQKGLNIKWKHAFFRTFSEATSNSNPINVKDGIYTNSKPGGEPVYMRVEDAFGCVTIKAIDLFVKSKPRTTAPSDFSICDTNGSGVTFFDLTSKEVEILAGLTASDYHVYYYASNSLAIEGDFDKAIKDPKQYSNLTSNTVYVRIEDKTTGCFSVELIHLKTVTLPDVATSVTDYVVCDSKEGTGKMKFILASKKPEITSSLSLKISFYETRTDAESALKPIDENNYTNKDAYTQTVYARVEDVKSGCFKIISINLIVNTYPAFDTAGNTITVCSTSNSGIGIFNLIEHGKKYIPSYNNFEFEFFESLENAQKNVNKIVDPEAYSNVKVTQTKVWVRIVNKVTGCVGIYDFDLKVNKAPVIVGKLPVTVICDNYNGLFDGKALFDLTIHEASIIPGVASGHGSSISYYKTQADADKAENAISSPKNYVSGGAEETIWYRLLDTTTGCSVVGSFNLKVTIGLELTKPQDLVSCSDISLGQNFAYFDLTTHKFAIVGGLPVFGTTYFYYESEADALAGTNAIATANLTKYKNKTAVQSIWMVVVNELGCRSMTIQTLIVYATPNPAKSATLSTCEATVGTGSAVFNLNMSVEEIINGDTNLDLYFYGTRTLAEEGDHTKTIPGPDKYTSTSKTIYVRVENKLALISPKCYVIVELKLVVNAIPALKDLKPLLACLEQVVDYYEFTLTDKDAEILNGRLASDYRITYYATQTEAQDNKKPLPYNYTNQTAKKQTIWVRLENKATGCFNVKRLLLSIEPKVEAFAPVVKEYCDDNDKVGAPVNDGFTSIDLTVYSLEIIGIQPNAANLIVTYYASMSDYNANIPILTPNDYVNISSPQTIIAVVKNKDKDLYCSALVELKIVVNKLPEVITDLEGGYLCKDLETGQVTPFLIDSKLDSSLYEFIWQFNGVEIPGAKLSYYEAKLAGNYTVSTVSKATGCASVNSATVTLTALAPFSITIDDTTGNRDEISENGKQTIIVNVLDQKTPAGVYEFALNDGSYQNSNVFYDVV